MPCGRECCVQLREVKDLDLDEKNIKVFLGGDRRFDFQSTTPAPAALRAAVDRYTRPRPCPGTQACPEECPCEVFQTNWGNWKAVTVRAKYTVPGIGELMAQTTAMRRIGRGVGLCEETEIAVSDQFFVPAGADVALALKPGVKISEQDVKRLDSLFTFDASSAPVAASAGDVAKPCPDAAREQLDT